MQKLFYPKWWLDAVGYFTNPPNKGPDVILFSPNPQGTPSDAKVQAPTSTIQIVVVTAAISSVLTLLVTFLVLKGNQKVEKMARRMNGYTEIEM